MAVSPLTESPRFTFWLYTWFIISPILLAFLDAVFHTHEFMFGPLLQIVENAFGIYAAHAMHYLTYFLPSIVLLTLAPLTLVGKFTMFASWILIDAVPIIYIYFFTISAIQETCS